MNSLFYTLYQQSLFPNSSYQHVSGGYPPNITDLTHQQLLEFHASKYHPSNSLFYLYGNFSNQIVSDLGNRLDAFDCISSNEMNSSLTSMDTSQRKPGTRRVQVHGPLDPSNFTFEI